MILIYHRVTEDTEKGKDQLWHSNRGRTLAIENHDRNNELGDGDSWEAYKRRERRNGRRGTVTIRKKSVREFFYVCL